MDDADAGGGTKDSSDAATWRSTVVDAVAVAVDVDAAYDDQWFVVTSTYHSL